MNEQVTMKIAHPSSFTAVDTADDPTAFTSFLDLLATCRGIGSGRAIVAERLGLGPGSTLLDLGCGTGDQTRELARRVAPGGRAVGVDLSQTMVDEARRRAAGADVAVEFEVGDAQALPYDDATFDACRAERMLIHVPDAGAALAEMVRVTRPGGRVAVIDADTESILFDSADRTVTRRVVASFTDNFQNGWIGRQLPRLMSGAGLTSLTVEPYVISFDPDAIAAMLDSHLALMVATGAGSEEGLGPWRAEVGDQAISLVHMTLFAVVGVKSER